VRSAPSSSSSGQRRFRKRNVSIAASLFLASCEGTITTDLTVGAPADPDLQQVVAPFTGIEFETSSGGTETFAFDEAERIDLLTFVRGAPIRLLSDEDLPEGTYTGVRLVFDDQTTDTAYVIDGLGAQRDLTIENGAFAEMDFTVEEDESSSEEITLTLDLRLSLSVDDDTQYTLRPVLRSVRTEEAGELEGLVTAPCLNDDATTNRGAMYLFQGENVTPDDFDGNGIEPYATAPIVLDGNGFNYRIELIPEGTYTVALACEGSEENPTTDDDLDFRATATVDINEGETTQQDIQL
jgi:hypothetical protein